MSLAPQAAGWISRACGLYLKTKLPDYMVPAALVELSSLPLNANGKLDREALPLPSADRQDEATFQAPKSELERRIAEIWQAVLGLTSVGIRDNFFDLGGHSLLLINVHASSSRRSALDVRIVELFQYPTIESLAEHLSGSVKSSETPAVRATSPVPRVDARSPIVGMAGRFPGARISKAFWHNLRDGVESIRVLHARPSSRDAAFQTRSCAIRTTSGRAAASTTSICSTRRSSATRRARPS